jgi:hypothetical protein
MHKQKKEKLDQQGDEEEAVDNNEESEPVA